MDFLIDFNRESRDDILEQLTSQKLYTSNDEFIGYGITINNLDELGKLEARVKEVTGEYYSLIISVSKLDGNTIYLDKDL